MLIDSLVETTSIIICTAWDARKPPSQDAILRLASLGIPMFGPKIQGRWEDFCCLFRRDLDLGGTPLNIMYFIFDWQVGFFKDL